MKILIIPEKEYRRIIQSAACEICKHRNNPYDKKTGQPTGCCFACCCSNSGTKYFEWPESVKVLDLK